MRIVAFEDRNAPLKNDDPVVEVLIDKMDGAPGDLAAIIEGLQLRVQTGKCGQQGRVDIQDAVRKCGNELR